MNWTEIPKTEIHLHLEGAAPPELIRTIAQEQGASLDGVFDEEGVYQWNDFAEFLECYQRATSVLKTPAHFRRLVEAVLEQSVANGVIYTEIFISPDLTCDSDAAAWVDHLAAMEAGASAVPEIETRFITTSIRNLGPAAAETVARLTVEHPSPRLTGFGMSGDERHMRAADFAKAFAIVEEAGLGLTCHAGELAGPESVTETLDALNVTRLGHGVRSIEDPAVVQRIVEQNIVLEINPGSNLALGLFAGLEAHPVSRLRDAGCAVTISTDDPPYFHIQLSSEYEALARVHGWTVEDFAAANRTAMHSAFCDETTRARLLKAFNAPRNDDV